MQSALIKLVIGTILVVSSLGGAWYSGYQKCAEAHQKEAVEQANRNAQALADQAKITEEKTREIYERKIELLKAKLSAGCMLGGDYRVLLDRAAGFEGASSRPIASETVARSVADNYAVCLQNAAWLVECQNLCR